MRAIQGWVDPFGVALAVATAIAMIVLQEGLLLAVVGGISVLAVRAVVGVLAVQRLRPTAIETKALPGEWYAPLTAKQAQVALLIAEGLKYSEIADRLDRSTRTVETHVTNINTELEKHTRMPFQNRSQIAVWITEQRARAARQSPPPGPAAKPVPKQVPPK